MMDEETQPPKSAAASATARPGTSGKRRLLHKPQPKVPKKHMKKRKQLASSPPSSLAASSAKGVWKYACCASKGQIALWSKGLKERFGVSFLPLFSADDNEEDDTTTRHAIVVVGEAGEVVHRQRVLDNLECQGAVIVSPQFVIDCLKRREIISDPTEVARYRVVPLLAVSRLPTSLAVDSAEKLTLEQGRSSDNEEDEEDYKTAQLLLSKYAALEPHRASDNVNITLCAWLKQLASAWSVLDRCHVGAKGSASGGGGSYRMRALAVNRLLVVLRLWPVKLTKFNFEREKPRLARQAYLGSQGASSSSGGGGGGGSGGSGGGGGGGGGGGSSSHLLEDVGQALQGWVVNGQEEEGVGSMMGKCLKRDRNMEDLYEDYPWLKFAMELSKQKWHIGPSKAKDLFEGSPPIRSVEQVVRAWHWGRGEEGGLLLGREELGRTRSSGEVAGAAENVVEGEMTSSNDTSSSSSSASDDAESLEVARRKRVEEVVKNDRLIIRHLANAPYEETNRVVDEEELRGITDVLDECCQKLGMEWKVVGSLRRGLKGTHDLDIVVRMPGRNDIFRPLGEEKDGGGGGSGGSGGGSVSTYSTTSSISESGDVGVFAVGQGGGASMPQSDRQSQHGKRSAMMKSYCDDLIGEMKKVKVVGHASSSFFAEDYGSSVANAESMATNKVRAAANTTTSSSLTGSSSHASSLSSSSSASSASSSSLLPRSAGVVTGRFLLTDSDRDLLPDHDVRHILIHSPALVALGDAGKEAQQPKQQQQQQQEEAQQQRAEDATSEEGIIHNHGSSKSGISGQSCGVHEKKEDVIINGEEEERFLSSSRRRRTMRRVDLVLCPSDQWSFTLWGWTGSEMHERMMRDYCKHARDDVGGKGLWTATGGRPIVGKRGWPESHLTPAGKVKSEHWGKPVTMRRELSPIIIPQDSDGNDDVEYWQVSQSGLRIMRGSQNTSKRSKNTVKWVEDPSQFTHERDIYEFLHLRYLEPHERCA